MNQQGHTQAGSGSQYQVSDALQDEAGWQEDEAWAADSAGADRWEQAEEGGDLGDVFADEESELLSDVDLGLSSADVCGRIEACVQGILESMAEGKPPELVLVSRASNNSHFYGPEGQLASGQAQSQITSQNSLTPAGQGQSLLSLSSGSFGGGSAPQINSSMEASQRPDSNAGFGSQRNASG